MKMRLELVPVPVSDVDRAKQFYTDQLGFHVDLDHVVSDEMRVVQLTPPGSSCSTTTTSSRCSTTPPWPESTGLSTWPVTVCCRCRRQFAGSGD